MKGAPPKAPPAPKKRKLKLAVDAPETDVTVYQGAPGVACCCC